jgi:pyruvate dehydrogenase E2 component (dihydrolipoamide acetyltransferase)
MAEVIRMPKMSDTMTEGVIAAWHKKVGDTVKSGDLLAEVETDKATMELESYESGTLLYIGVKAKEAAPIDGVIAVIGKSGENIDDLLKNIKSGGNTNGDAKPKEEKTPEPVASNEPSVDLSGIKAEVIRMPKMSDTMTEGTIVAWNKKVGDKVKSGELLAEVATDKATMELESYSDGTLLYIGVQNGEAVAVDGVLAIIGEAGVDYKPLLSASSKPATQTTEAKKEEPVAQTKNTTNTTSNQSSSDSRLKASPLAKKIAKEKGIDIKQIHGSGEHGRIVKKDVETFTPSSGQDTNQKTDTKSSVALPQVVGQESYDEVPVSQMRKAIAKRVVESLSTSPHFYIVMEINMDKAIEARTSINEVASVKVSFNDMVIKATAAALRKHPLVNSSWLGDKIRYNHHINIGVAMAIGEALMIPVVRFADNKSLSHIGAEVKDFSAKAKNKQLTPADWTGSTFTISNLGMFGVDEFTAIINPPDACILAVGGIKQTPVVKNGQIVVGNLMKVTLSCDHRVVDGAIGAAFLQTLKSLLEDPIRILA